MRRPLLSLLSRLSAGVLLFQAAAPGALAVKETFDAAAARRRVLDTVLVPKPPKPMKGVPTMRVTPAVPAPPLPAHLGEPPPGTYLDDVARRPGGIDPALVAAWRAELAKPGPSATRRAWLQLWMGESRLAVEEPDEAEGWLARAAALGRGGPVEGVAAYDLAAARFYEGRYQEAGHELRALMKSRKRGYARRDAALFLRHAGLCEGYHAAHERLGVPQPPRLDPLCGVASVAVCLRALALPYDRSYTVGAVPHHGMGSSLADLARSVRRLGLSPHTVSVRRDKGLIALPKPLVAHVEHDHFVAVVDADAKGVEYVCSDCGAWPGGPVRLTWKQWRALEADVYLALSKPGSVADLALAALEKGQASRDVGLVASRALPSPAAVRQGAAVRNLLGALEAGVVAQTSDPGQPTVTCGQHPDSGKCIPCAMAAAMAQSGGSGIFFGASGGAPVNLATAEEEYAPVADLDVYNPTGPSVAWGHVYGSLSRFSSGFGEGWTQPYSRGVELTSASSSLAGGVMFADGARMTFTGAKPTVSAPHAVMSLGAGMPYLLSADYDSASGGCTFTLTDERRTQWTTLAVGYPNDCIRGSTIFPLAKETDRAGNWIGFRYATYSPEWVSGIKGSTVYRLTEIDDSAGVALLTIGMDSNGWIVSATDRYHRAVYYQASDHDGETPKTPDDHYQIPHHLLDQVSQVVAPNTQNPPVRYQYYYGQGPTGEPQETVPYLSSVSVPSPTGSGMATLRWTYTPDFGLISQVTDANGNATDYTFAFTGGDSVPSQNPGGDGGGGSGPPPFPGATVKILGASGVVRQYGLVSDMNMNPTQLVDANGATVWTKTYADSNTPYRPSSVTDGNNRTWSYTWDRYGHLLTATTPKGTVTTRTYDYSHFALGELVSVKVGAKTATRVSYYEPTGLPEEVDAPVPGQSGTGSTQATTYAYTAMGQLASVTAPGNNAAASETTTLGYTTDPTYGGQAESLGEPLTVTDALGKTWHLRYNDGRGNRTGMVDPLGNITSYGYDPTNAPVQVALPTTNEAGAVSTFIDHLYTGGPVADEYVRGGSGGVVRSVGFAYGPEGELLSRVGGAEELHLTYDPAYATQTLKGGVGATTTYRYDLSGRPTEIDYPLAAATGTADRVFLSAYDVVGNLLSRTDGNGQETDYAYGDADGLLSAATHPGAPGSDVGLTYDAYDRAVATTDGAGAESTAYDDLDAVVSSTRTYTNVPAQAFAYGYYPDGSRQTMANAAGTWTYGYDADGRYVSMASPAGASGAAYLDNGWESARGLPNGASTSYAYDPAGALTSLQNRTSGGAALSQYGSFAYDGVYNAAGVTASVAAAASQGGSTTYAYDSKDRLTSESSTRLGGYAQTNAYDADGDPTTLRGGAQTFDADDRQTGPASFVYDGNGAPTTYRGLPMAYDAEGRATQLSSLAAGYRGDGLRAWKEYAGAKAYFYYDEDGDPVMETDASGNVTATNVFAPDGLVARGSGGSWTQYAFDPEGNVAQRLDSGGSVLSSSAYDGYGKESDAGTAPTDPFGYHARDGYYLDRETGLYLCQNRYYDPGTGRWITRDPMGYSGGVNLYGYCGSGPVGVADPSGLWSVYRWGYTGDGDASDEVYDASLNQAWHTLNRWWSNFKDENEDFWPEAVGVGAACSVPYWPSTKSDMERSFSKNGDPYSSWARRFQNQMPRRTIAKAAARAVANFVKRDSLGFRPLLGRRLAPVAAGAHVAVAGFLTIEAILAWRAALKTVNEPLIAQDD